MPFTGIENLAISTVATAPSPATTGTTVTVATGHGARFPATTSRYMVVIWPAASSPDPTNAEVCAVTGITGDTLTIVRAQEGSTARSVTVGDQIMMTVTAGDMRLRDALASYPLWTQGVR
jgi:hypothetical protein